MSVQWDHPLAGECLGEPVHIRDEDAVSLVVLPTDGRPSCDVPDNIPDVNGVCCVPVVMVRTPTGDDDGSGHMRWAALEDVRPVSPDEISTDEGVA